MVIRSNEYPTNTKRPTSKSHTGNDIRNSKPRILGLLNGLTPSTKFSIRFIAVDLNFTGRYFVIINDKLPVLVNECEQMVSNANVIKKGNVNTATSSHDATPDFSPNAFASSPRGIKMDETAIKKSSVSASRMRSMKMLVRAEVLLILSRAPI